MALDKDEGNQPAPGKPLVFGTRLGEIGSLYVHHLQAAGQWAVGLWSLGFAFSVFGLTARFVDNKDMAAAEFAAMMGLAAVVFLVGGVVYIATVKYGQSVLTTQAGYSAYTEKKATRAQPTITGVFPSILVAGQRITITGSGLTQNPPPKPSSGSQELSLYQPQVTINGKEALMVTVDPNVVDRLTAVVPGEVIPPGTQIPVSGTVQVLSAYGFITPGFGVELS